MNTDLTLDAEPIAHRSQCDNPAACIARGAGHCRFCQPQAPEPRRQADQAPGPAR